MQVSYPTILRRYMSTFIDGAFVVSTFIALSYVFQEDSQLENNIRIAVFFTMFFIYEPICTSLFCTMGQRLTGIRVRKFNSKDRISIPAAYLRIIVKIVLGFISLLTIPFTNGRRAIHDFTVNSVVIMEKKD